MDEQAERHPAADTLEADWNAWYSETAGYVPGPDAFVKLRWIATHSSLSERTRQAVKADMVRLGFPEVDSPEDFALLREIAADPEADVYAHFDAKLMLMRHDLLEDTGDSQATT